MTDIDELARRAAAAARARSNAETDIDAGLARVLAADAFEPQHDAGPRRWLVAGAAALIVAATAAGIALTAGDSAAPPPPPATEAPTRPGPPTTLPTSTLPPVRTTAPAGTISDVPDDGLAVSHLAPPPLIAATPFASGDILGAAIGPDGTVIVVDGGGTATATRPDRSTTTVHLEVTPRDLVAGPRDVLYGIHDRPNADPDIATPDTALVAIALSGELAGRTLARVPVDPNAYVEIPPGTLGNGPAGVIDRRTGELLMGWIDPTGRPTDWPTTPPPARISIDPATNVVASTAGPTWPLRIERHPEWSGDSYAGEAPPAPTADGGATLWTSLGPPVDAGDFAPPTIRVIAHLHPDGTATWRQLADGWSVLGSDVGGTVLARSDGTSTEVAVLEPLTS